MFYHHYEHKIPDIILNKDGEIYLENKNKISLRFEIDYNLMSEKQIEKIKNGNELEFAISTKCITYNGKENYKMENSTYIPAEKDNVKYYIPVKTENNSINFRMIKKNIEIYKDGTFVMKTEINHSKIIDLTLADGTYDIKCNVYTVDNELITIGNLKLHLNTNYYKINNNDDKNSVIEFEENKGNFNIILTTNSKRLYSFKIADIVSKNDNIFDFTYYNPSSNDKKEIGKIGSVLNLLNDKQIDEIIETPELEKLISPKFIFDINELFTTQHSPSDIGVIRFPTIREKIKDTFSPYYNLKCDVSQSHSVDFDKSDDLLVTDKFKNYPLFYKFFIDTPFDSIRIIDENDNEVTDFIVDKISDEVNIVYFNPLRNKKYYYILDNDPPLHIRYKRSIESYKMIFDKELEFHNNKLEFEYPMYFGDLMLKGNGTYDVEIQFVDYSRKVFKLNAVDKEFKFLEDERIKIDNKIISLEIKTKDKVTAISMVCNFKNNRLNFSYFKDDFRNFVYIANPVGEIDIDKIPENELSKFNINKKFIFKDGVVKEVPNGPLYLEQIKKQDIVFTDIEEWLKEYSIENIDVAKTSVKDEFFLENVINSSMEIEYEDK